MRMPTATQMLTEMPMPMETEMEMGMGMLQPNPLPQPVHNSSLEYAHPMLIARLPAADLTLENVPVP